MQDDEFQLGDLSLDSVVDMLKSDCLNEREYSIITKFIKDWLRGNYRELKRSFSKEEAKSTLPKSIEQICPHVRLGLISRDDLWEKVVGMRVGGCPLFTLENIIEASKEQVRSQTPQRHYINKVLKKYGNNDDERFIIKRDFYIDEDNLEAKEYFAHELRPGVVVAIEQDGLGDEGALWMRVSLSPGEKMIGNFYLVFAAVGNGNGEQENYIVPIITACEGRKSVPLSKAWKLSDQDENDLSKKVWRVFIFKEE